MVPNAQLIHFDSDEKWNREHWEDEEITYGCENKSLVLNSMKGVRTKSYLCAENGEYDTPEEEHEWPKCTTKAIDPCKSIR